MRNLAASGIGGQLFHEISILTSTLVGGRVFEIEIPLDVVGRKLDTGLLVGDRALRPNTDGVTPLPYDLVNISGIILTGVVALEYGSGNLVLNQALGTLRLRNLGGSVIKDHIDNIHIGSVNLRNGMEVESEPLSAVSPTAMVVSGSRSAGSSKK